MFLKKVFFYRYMSAHRKAITRPIDASDVWAGVCVRGCICFVSPFGPGYGNVEFYLLVYQKQRELLIFFSLGFNPLFLFDQSYHFSRLKWDCSILLLLCCLTDKRLACILYPKSDTKSPFKFTNAV